MAGRKKFVFFNECYLLYLFLNGILLRLYSHCDRLLEEQESDPNFWFSELAHKYHAENIAAVAKLIGANESNIVFVENTTSGMNLIE